MWGQDILMLTTLPRLHHFGYHTKPRRTSHELNSNYAGPVTSVSIRSKFIWCNAQINQKCLKRWNGETISRGNFSLRTEWMTWNLGNFVFVSLLSHFWLFHLHLLYQPYLDLSHAQCVQSHQRQPISAVAITPWEIQVSTADSQTVPTVATGV